MGSRFRMTRLSDAVLTQRARRAKALEQKIAELATKKATLEQSIIKEMERRNTRVIVNNGVRITKVQQEPEQINSAALLADLTPRQRKLCIKSVFDRAGLQAAVQGGLIDIQVVKDHSETVPRQPYVVITLGAS